MFGRGWLLWAGLLLLLAACASGPSPGTTVPTAANAPTRQVAAPPADKGVVVGRLVSTDPDKSLEGLDVFFATLVPLTPGPDHLVSMDLASTPRAKIAADGSFVAENLEPGQYALVLWAPVSTRFVPNPEHPEREYIVTVQAGKIIDVGTLMVTPP